MATETVDVAETNEYPDIVGAKPSNPYLAAFRPYIPDKARLRELTPLPLIIGTLLGILKYPEGTPGAELLKAGASDGSRAGAVEGARGRGVALTAAEATIGVK